MIESRRRDWAAQLLRLHSWLVYLFLYAPIAVLIVYSFNRAKRYTTWGGFTTDWYARLLSNAQVRASVYNSLLVAAVTTVAATIIGTAAALALARHARRGAATRGLLFLPVVVPEIVTGAALVTFFGLARFRLGLGTVILAHVAFSVSYVAIVVRARLAGLDRSLEEAAMDLGAGPVGTFARVTLPQIAPGVLAAALLAFTVSLDDYVITSFVAGPGATTLPLRIYSMLRTEVTPEVNAACTVLLLATVVLIALSQRLLLRGK